MDCEIVGGTLVTPSGRRPGVLALHDGRIAAILDAPSGSAQRTINAEGLLVLPGMVDQHVHFMDPGDSSREDFISGSGAAVVGGVTTVLEHTHSAPVLTAAQLAEKGRYLATRSLVDYGLVAHVFPESLAEVPSLHAAGAAYFKAFTCTTHGVPALLADDLLRAFGILAALDARALVHCEDEAITADNEERLHAAQRKDNGVILEWRSPEAELVATSTVALLARLTGARVTIAHASQPEVVALVARERALGARLTVETCPQYLYLDADAVREHGPLRKFTPPARELPAREGLWQAVAAGEIDVLSTDHAPSTLEQKLGSDIWTCHFGLPGVQTTLPLLLTAATKGHLTLEQVVLRYSEMPARLAGLYPRKGALLPGSDADVVLVDPAEEYTLRNADMLSKAGWTPYDGMAVRGRPVLTLLRGTVVAERGQVMARPGLGCWLRAAHAEGSGGATTE